MFEPSAKNWVDYFTTETLSKNHLKKLTIKVPPSSLTLGFGFNLRRMLFKDIRVRQALTDIFDFSTINRLFFHGLYYQSRSFFNDAPFHQKIIQTPHNSKHLNKQVARRTRFAKAVHLLNLAGWKQKNGVLEKNNHPFVFDFITHRKEYERLLSIWQSDLRKIGIKMRIVVVDSTLYHERIHNGQFDMTDIFIQHPEQLGFEQMKHWADHNNILGLNDQHIMKLITKLAGTDQEKTRNKLSQELDKALLKAYVMIPGWHTAYNRIVCSDKIKFPPKMDGYTLFDVCAAAHW